MLFHVGISGISNNHLPLSSTRSSSGNLGSIWTGVVPWCLVLHTAYFNIQHIRDAVVVMAPRSLRWQRVACSARRATKRGASLAQSVESEVRPPDPSPDEKGGGLGVRSHRYGTIKHGGNDDVILNPERIHVLASSRRRRRRDRWERRRTQALFAFVSPSVESHPLPTILFMKHLLPVVGHLYCFTYCCVAITASCFILMKLFIYVVL